MRVNLKGNRILGVSKELPKARSHGEYTGVSLLRGIAPRIYGDINNEWQWRANTRGYYEDVYNEMAERVEARAAEVAAGEYAEVDTPEDLAAASRGHRAPFLGAPRSVTAFPEVFVFDSGDEDEAARDLAKTLAGLEIEAPFVLASQHGASWPTV